ncbi:MAG TPA: copper resistance protein NlpE [Brumimicrobium sp.]|nr:copper resistance protein NlpE [Brumimicrobium sp.]
MKKTAFFLLLSLPLLFACNTNEKLKLGTYYGQIPCADCPGINVQLELKEDQTYLVKNFYLGENDVFEEQGSFKIQADSILVLEKTDDENQLYLIEKNELTMLDSKGKKSDSKLADFYKLKMEKPEGFTLSPKE